MGKKGKKTYKGFTYKTLLILLFVGTNVKPNQENPCLWLIIQLLIGDPMVCGYLTAQMILTTLCVIWKAIDTTMERYYDKGLLEWFDGGLVPPRPRIVLDKQSGPEKMEHYYDKGHLEWLDGGLVPPCPRIVLDKQSGPEQWDV